MTTSDADLQSLIDTEAQRVAAFNDSEQPWQDCPQEPIHHKGHYCEHQVRELAEHLVRNHIQVEDARRKALVDALKEIRTMPCLMELLGEPPTEDDPCGCAHCRAKAALKGEEA